MLKFFTIVSRLWTSGNWLNWFISFSLVAICPIIIIWGHRYIVATTTSASHPIGLCRQLFICCRSPKTVQRTWRNGLVTLNWLTDRLRRRNVFARSITLGVGGKWLLMYLPLMSTKVIPAWERLVAVFIPTYEAPAVTVASSAVVNYWCNWFPFAIIFIALHNKKTYTVISAQDGTC